MSAVDEAGLRVMCSLHTGCCCKEMGKVLDLATPDSPILDGVVSACHQLIGQWAWPAQTSPSKEPVTKQFCSTSPADEVCKRVERCTGDELRCLNAEDRDGASIRHAVAEAA